MEKIHGIVVPLVTPLSTPTCIDFQSTERLLDHVISGGVNGIFILGSTGEGPALSQEMQREFIRLCAEKIQNRLPLLVGISGASAADSLSMGLFAAENGADAIVCTVPCYIPPDEDEILNFFKTLADKTNFPLFAYNMPALTRVDISAELVWKLSKIDGIIGYKDSSGNMEALRAVLERTRDRDDFAVFVGPEALTLQSLKLGADGGVNGGANLYPELFASLYNTFLNNDDNAMTNAQQKIMELQTIYGPTPKTQGVIRALKYALATKGIIKNVLAFPSMPQIDRQIA